MHLIGYYYCLWASGVADVTAFSANATLLFLTYYGAQHLGASYAAHYLRAHERSTRGSTARIVVDPNFSITVANLDLLNLPPAGTVQPIAGDPISRGLLYAGRSTCCRCRH